ncbi:cytoskeleton-associated protein [Niveomyces insectorum RCEF 264]|uniref:Cytoskeleton-associated protein n=1 Tax=Niveomyces insectorum RCEF 264 TaxID=1081102 RepID=A0A167WE70_9HYPO|nr:cytoskeleton-associated protein [Niveomyces insectorum RCEF 264]
MSTTTTTTTTAAATFTTNATSVASSHRPSTTTTNTNNTASPAPSYSSRTLPRSLRRRLPITTTTTTTAASSSAFSGGSALAFPRAGNATNITTGTTGFSTVSTRSTPNLSSLFASHGRRTQQQHHHHHNHHHQQPPLPPLPPPPPPLVIRKGSLAALTSSSLATIPDDTESYVLDTLSELASSFAVASITGADSNNNTESKDTNSNNMGPLTPNSRLAAPVASNAAGGDDVATGDVVDVPGGMSGTVRFVGTVAGRKGVFAGVELHSEFAARGKNSGDVDGVSYFNTNVPGAGIFLPLNKAVRRDSPAGSFPTTPTANGTGLKLSNQNSTNFTPPTPSIPKFSQSVNGAGGGPGPIRAPSPLNRKPPRTSLPRPDSPVRRLQMTPGPARPSLATPAPKSNMPAPGRFGSPTSNKFSQSVRAPIAGGGGDPSKKGLGLFRTERKGSIGPRSASALGGASHFGDDDGVGAPNASAAAPSGIGFGRTKTNGSVGSVSSSVGQRAAAGGGRPASRTTSHTKNGSIATATTLANDEEVERLRTELEDRERQLKDQASTLADMESSLTELQTLIESPDGPLNLNGYMNGAGGGGSRNGGNFGSNGGSAVGGGGDGGDGRRNSLDDKDLAQLRALLREKNEKIAMLTAEFDAHRADFRSTIDTLEMASTETERVYEKKIEEMMQEIHELESRLADVDAVAHQLKQLEELVQELEEGLEDARRGEAEARGEVEFLRGEVERTRTELRREREKAAQLMANGGHSGGNGPGSSLAPAAGASGGPPTTPVRQSFGGNPSKELEQKDDEIRGLKAIIHSLSQNAGVGMGGEGPDHNKSAMTQSTTQTNGSNGFKSQHRRGESINERLARDQLEREVAELRALLDTKVNREADMEREIAQLRLAPATAANGTAAASAPGANGGHRGSAMTVASRSSSLRDSRGTVVLARDFRDYRDNVNSNGVGNGVSNGNGNSTVTVPGTANAGTSHTASPGDRHSPDAPRKLLAHHTRGSTLDTMPESDAYSSVTETSTLWCEICETNGHDILTCTNMFGPQAAASGASVSKASTMSTTTSTTNNNINTNNNGNSARTGKDVVRAAGLKPSTLSPPSNGQLTNGGSNNNILPRPLSPAPLLTSSTSTNAPPPPTKPVQILPNPMESGPVAGKESGVVDADKWCALCERDGHDSVDCPFEDAF